MYAHKLYREHVNVESPLTVVVNVDVPGLAMAALTNNHPQLRNHVSQKVVSTMQSCTILEGSYCQQITAQYPSVIHLLLCVR